MLKMPGVLVGCAAGRLCSWSGVQLMLQEGAAGGGGCEILYVHALLQVHVGRPR